ncbi:ABC transporter substrate-binding protein [Micromonospora sp. SL1-18]|uniref:ABC transporter substrate-binding protein n=1 Tax=Micromonospora sp. SL1-18 TaxID=3399128 RepID=UPI003A4E10D7
MRLSRPAALLAALAAAALLLSTTACGSTDDRKPAGRSGSDAPVVVASTTWVGALAKAAGATDVKLVAPANIQHPPDYDPKPSDLAAVASADYVLYTPFDGFAARLKEAVASGAKLVMVEPENTPAKITSEVTRLGQLFGTGAAAARWLDTFNAEYASLSGKLKNTSLNTTAVAQVFVAYWADFAGIPVAGTYGPEPVTPSQLADLSGKKPKIQLANGHLPGLNPQIAGAVRVDIINYPGEDLDLLSVFRTNADHLGAAITGAAG